MTVERFFELFLEELKNKQHLWSYYKFHMDEKSFLFRKAYLCQRLEYVAKYINSSDLKVLDIGCGYGTTALFLAMNGIAVHGTTLEFYIDEIESRKKYWSQYGNVDLFTISYENLFDEPPKEKYDFVIIQDTLHHLEPIDEALTIIKNSLKPMGKLLLIEVNGNNIVQNLIFFKLRGFKKITYLYDERLKKKILIGNENVRSYTKWKSLIEKAGMNTISDSVEYVRYFYPKKFAKANYAEVLKEEQEIWRKSAFKREYFFWGVNFLAELK
jgi:2-polyprenyl-3-methyl-5-hydroxy-6-metoxy-1,4-benzoquinol methylase